VAYSAIDHPPLGHLLLLGRKHTVLNEKLKRRIDKTREENQQIIAGTASNGISWWSLAQQL
jgi:hypothetical protein